MSWKELERECIVSISQRVYADGDLWVEPRRFVFYLNERKIEHSALKNISF